MIFKTIISFALTAFLGTTIYAQNIGRRKAIQTAKRDPATKLRHIKSVQLVTDSLTNKRFWLVEEQVNIRKEQSVFNDGGMHFIYANQLKIDAETGTIISREEIEVRRVHEAPKF